MELLKRNMNPLIKVAHKLAFYIMAMTLTQLTEDPVSAHF